MKSEEQIHALCLRVAAAPDGSEELRVAMDELRTALKGNAERGRAKLAELQRSLPHTEGK